MSEPVDLSVRRALEAAAALKEISADFAERETRLLREIGSRRMTETRKFREEQSRMEAWHSDETAKAQNHFEETASHIKDLTLRRRSRIERLHRVGLENLQKQARLAKERWQGGLQMRHFKASRHLPLDLQVVDQEQAQFSANLAGWQAAIRHLEQTAHKAFRGYRSLRRLLAQPSSQHFDETDRDLLLTEVQTHYQAAEARLAEFRAFSLPKLFAVFPLAFIIPFLCGTALAAILIRGLDQPMRIAACAASVLLAFGLIVLHRRGLSQSRATAESAAASLSAAHRASDLCAAAAQQYYDARRVELQSAFNLLCAEIDQGWKDAPAIEQKFAVEIRAKLDAQAPRLLARLDAIQQRKLAENQSTHRDRQSQIESQVEPWKTQLSSSYSAESTALAAEETARWDAIQTEWKQAIEPLYASVAAMHNAVVETARPWDEELVSTWTPPARFTPAVKFAHLALDLASLPHPKDPRLALPGPAQLDVPLALTFPDQGSLLLETSDSSSAAVMGTMNNIILRLLAATPPGKIAFTIIDPLGLGQNFAGLMHLTDFEESIINRRIWTQRDHIEERLAELNEHIEKVIQMYLRNEYATITEYNEQAGSVAEKYHFLVVADFPANFSETAAKRLQSIMMTGPRCGVFTLLHWDLRQHSPEGFTPDDLRKSAITLRRDRAAWTFSRERVQPSAALTFEVPPASHLAIDLVHKIGQASIDSNRVEVPFSQITPAPADYWTNDTSAELRIPIGRTGATKLQYLAIGKGTRQHALFAGKTGSGKSTLFHVIITNLALSCSPEQVEFYLIDFKKGVEFKCYAAAKLPHARVIAIESDREFGLSVLQRVDQELKRRGDLFRQLGVQDIPGYFRAGGTEPMPRSLLLIDEFQEFFVQDDEISQTASLLFDRIVRQGRAFGIHVLLGSQTLGGAYTLARATLGQMVIRVALQCSEADAYLIMDDNNPAPRLLSRPGEGIYNDAAGALEGNSPFQVVWLSDSERDARLDDIRDLAEKKGRHYPGPIVFEGNAPADVTENYLLQSALTPSIGSAIATTTARAASPTAWFGAPNSIKGPTEAAFPRQSGSHLLVVGQNEEAIATMIGLSIVALAAQNPAARFVLFSPEGRSSSPLIDRTASVLGAALTIVQPPETTDAISALSKELQARLDGEAPADAPPIFAFIHHLHRFKKLRSDDDFDFSGSSEASASEQLKTLLAEGSTYGIHIIATVDTFNNVGRFLSRKALGEFEMRIVFQMSANDSASLIDSPAAGDLGLHRALFYNEPKGTLETFRPYAPPPADWIDTALENLQALRSSAAKDASVVS